MPQDIKLEDLDIIPTSIIDKLRGLEIRTLRQLFERLKGEGGELQDYLKLSDEEFSSFRGAVRDLIEEKFPEDSLPHLYPEVNKRGVAVHRLHDTSRPKYYKEGDE